MTTHQHPVGTREEGGVEKMKAWAKKFWKRISTPMQVRDERRYPGGRGF
jgi:hypothetical protein